MKTTNVFLLDLLRYYYGLYYIIIMVKYKFKQDIGASLQASHSSFTVFYRVKTKVNLDLKA